MDLRLENNVRIVSSLRDGEPEVEKEFSQNAFKDANTGWASETQSVIDDDMTERLLARRLGVMEYREYAGGWRMRPVDDETEGLANECAHFDQRGQNETLDTLLWMIMKFLGAGVFPFMWRADISSFFRRLPIRVDHLQYATCVFRAMGANWAAVKLTCNFWVVF